MQQKKRIKEINKQEKDEVLLYKRDKDYYEKKKMELVGLFMYLIHHLFNILIHHTLSQIKPHRVNLGIQPFNPKHHHIQLNKKNLGA